MVLFVPYDASPLADAALDRAAALGDRFDQDVHAFTVIPQNATYAREHGWLPAGDPFDREVVTTYLAERVAALAPDAEHDVSFVDAYASAGHISRIIRDRARKVGVTVAFVGSESAGHVIRPASSVGSVVTAADEFDVYIVRSTTAVGFEGD